MFESKEGSPRGSELRAVIRDFQTDDLAGMPDACLEEDFAELQRAKEALEVERLRRLAELDRRRPFARDGILSTSSWLAQAFAESYSGASGDLRMARALEAMPRTRAAVASGEISTAAARVLVSARESDPEEFSSSEEVLLDAARRLNVRDLGRAVAYWRNGVESRRPEAQAEALRDARNLHVSPMGFGMVRIDGDLDPETGEAVLTALGAVLDAEARRLDLEDGRSPAQRRADALGEVCLQYLGDPERPEVAGERPHVSVIVSLDSLQGRQGEPCELEHTGPVSPGTARRWACDASVTRIVTAGRSEPLDVGRQTPMVPAAIRRALVIRDRHCGFPGCHRIASWCDAHHVIHWADGGPTALSNLVLLCRRHHRLVHRGFSVEMKGGRPVFRRPDRTVIEAPP